MGVLIFCVLIAKAGDPFMYTYNSQSHASVPFTRKLRSQVSTYCCTYNHNHHHQWRGFDSHQM